MRLIDADALGMYLNYWRYGDFSDIKHEREYAVLSDVIEAVHHAPTVDAVERKRGRWEQVANDDNGIDFRCSVCHRYRFHNGEMIKDDGSVGKVGDLREMLDEIEALPTIIEAEEGET